MNELTKLHCSPINENTPKSSDNEITQYLSGLPNWHLTLKDGEQRLEKTYEFKDFKQAMEFTNKLAQAANEEDHHPAILTEWGKVTVDWWTHKIRGLHQNDFIMAAKTDEIYQQ